MKLIRKITLKLLLLSALCLVLNEVYHYIQFPSDLEQHANGYDLMLKDAVEADLLYFGDCSDAYREDGLETEPGIGSLIGNQLVRTKVSSLSSNGFHPGTYLKLIEMISAVADSTEKTLIVTMNLRAFSTRIINDFIYDPKICQQLQPIEPRVPALVNRAWITYHRNPVDHNNQLKEKIESGWKHDTLPEGFPYVTLFDWHSVYNNVDSTWTIENEYIQSYLYDFGFVLDAKNPRIADFDQISAICKENNWTLYFHIVPIDYRSATRYAGSRLTHLISVNRKFLINRYPNIIDNSGLITTDGFIGEYANSHYRLEARKKMAEKVAKEIMR